jgi:hypothetical protein
MRTETTEPDVIELASDPNVRIFSPQESLTGAGIHQSPRQVQTVRHCVSLAFGDSDLEYFARFRFSGAGEPSGTIF